MKFDKACFSVGVVSLWLFAACAFWAGVPARGYLGGQTLEARVDSEVARYYLENYLAGRRRDSTLDARIDRAYRRFSRDLPDRDQLKILSDEFSVDFAAIFFADRITRTPISQRFRSDFEKDREQVRRVLSLEADGSYRAGDGYEIVFVPGYLYRRHPATGADFAGPRAVLQRVGFPHRFIATDEDGAIETNANLVLAALRALSSSDRRLIVVSASKSGPEVALALTQWGRRAPRHVAAWVNIVGTLGGTPLADEKLWLEMEDLIGQVDLAGVESLSTGHSRKRFSRLRVPANIFVINYLGIPVGGSVSSLARPGFQQLRKYGPNDGLSLLADMIYPGGLTLAELGRDHFLLDEELAVTTLAMTKTIVRWLEQNEFTEFRAD